LLEGFNSVFGTLSVVIELVTPIHCTDGARLPFLIFKYPVGKLVARINFKYVRQKQARGTILWY